MENNKIIFLVKGKQIDPTVKARSMGYTGKGMIIAVLDAGFYHVGQLPAFDSLRARGQILGTRDFVTGDTMVYEDHAHGMHVLSILAGLLPGEMRGSAPAASFWLLRTEDVFSEYPVEEVFWTAGAEFADSVGADIIHSSLGHYEFDDPSMSYTYSDMNGHTTRVARTALMAARRGMIVVVSAGNEGNKKWHYIISPADADSILAVGAVDAEKAPATFTSYGPSADGRVKPDVSAMGVSVLIQGVDGGVTRGNGTSYASPLISGLTACLWQAYPTATAQEVIQTLRQSTDHYLSPDERKRATLIYKFLINSRFSDLAVQFYINPCHSIS
jgi:subtilisin family serine protease